MEGIMNGMNRWVALMICVAASGCADPIVGSWTAEQEAVGCSDKDAFTVDDELTGDGELWVPTTQGACTECGFDLELEEDDGRYTGDLDFDNCACEGNQQAEVDCTLEDDVLDCEIDWSGPTGPCLQGSQELERDE